MAFVSSDFSVKLVYENRGEKLGLAHADLNERMAEKIEQADLDPDQGVEPVAEREVHRLGMGRSDPGKACIHIVGHVDG